MHLRPANRLIHRSRVVNKIPEKSGTEWVFPKTSGLAHDVGMSRGFSVVIAAHNEGAVIEATLRSVLNNKLDRPLQVIVVANGCSDDTAEKARKFGDAVEVIETPVGNKINAIN